MPTDPRAYLPPNPAWIGRDIERVEIAHLTLPSGRLVLTDPWLEPGRGALPILVPRGRYPVSLLVAKNAIADGSQIGRHRALRGLSLYSEDALAATVHLAAGRPTRFVELELGGAAHGALYAESGTLTLCALEAARSWASGRSALGAEDCGEPRLPREVDVARFVERVIEPDTGANAVLFSVPGGGPLVAHAGYRRDGRLTTVTVELGLTSTEWLAHAI